jgi:hypothetical protein
MKKVVCINDKKLPPGAKIVLDHEYEIESEFLNNFDQKVFIISGITNEGRTKYGLPWKGYNANRFADVKALAEESFEYSYVING